LCQHGQVRNRGAELFRSTRALPPMTEAELAAKLAVTHN
jgi:hypothetical protein